MTDFLTPSIVGNPTVKSLVSKCMSMTPKPGRFKTDVNRLLVVRYDSDSIATMVVKPSIFFILQGFSHSEFALNQKITPPQSFLVIGPQLPMVARIKASKDNPLVVLVLHLDFQLLQALSVMISSNPKQDYYPGSWVTNGRMDVTMNQLLINLLDCQAKTDTSFEQTPSEILALYSYVLSQPQGTILRKLSAPPLLGLINSINWANDRYNEQMSVAELAKVADMSLTSYHRHFKSVTTLSPLQYLKTVKLLEARRLMLFYGKTAAHAAQYVGYESPSQFNREYKRFFTMPPHKEVSYTLYHNRPIYQPLSLTHRF
ncbi:MAG: AraC family transcriptional regulator [Deltaproteobacteria bacterium]|jgi:AraC-like DNA-binding protein|nr:AraC family transcriptional regulator [Deltaproteobacteria bacterium]